MTAITLIQCIGCSHLLQPPLTLLLSTERGVGLRAALVPQTRLAAEVMYNMAVASIAWPTLLGLLIAYYAADALHPGSARTLTGMVSLFWCWRLYRQLLVLGPLWPNSGRLSFALNPLLALIFAVQGPGLGLLLLR